LFVLPQPIRSRLISIRMTFRRLFSSLTVATTLGVSLHSSVAGYKEDIGLTALLSELGAGAPTGAGIALTQVEFGFPNTSNYLADVTHSELLGKTVTAKSGAGAPSGHATTVGRNLFGTVNGTAPGPTQIDAYEANGWLNNDFLRVGNSTAEPVVETRRIQNHSWVASYPSEANNQDAIRRYDYAIQRDGFVAVVGLNNWNTNPVPALLAHSYNAISVGVPNGQHSSGGTTFDVAGRLKPEIVSPSAFGAVSYSVGAVSGAAALLLQTADASPPLFRARTNSEVIKAVLLAGATKSQFPTWSRTPTQPLDPIYGAGQLNIQRSYHLLVAGEHASSSSVTVSNRGWDFATTTASAAQYFFDVPAGFTLTNFSTVLTWNRRIGDATAGSLFTMTNFVANLNLRLYAAIGFTPGAQLDSSTSTIQNVEHIYAPTLGAGRYCLEVTSDVTGTDYALAWGGAVLTAVSTTVNNPAWGSVAPASGNYPVGSSLQFLATPANYYRFSHWTGSLTGTNNPIALNLTSNLTVTAMFAERFTTNYPTPYPWLASYGYTSNQEIIVTNLGANGHALWQSYIAGLNPTNSASQLRFTSQQVQHGTNFVLTWNTVPDRLYTLWFSTNLATGFAPVPGAVNLPATMTSFTNSFSPLAPRQLHRLEVQKP
jgi:hypothetical protein